MNPPLSDEPPTREVDRRPIDKIVSKAQGNKPSKTVYVVIAIDEAHHLLDRKRLNHPSLALPESTEVAAQEKAKNTTGSTSLAGKEISSEQKETAAQDLIVKEQQEIYQRGTMTCTNILYIDDLDESGKTADQISFFTLLRRIGRRGNLRNSIKIPFVFTSTNSRLSNFLPHLNYDPSRRYLIESSNTPVPTYLHRPMILQETMDVWSRKLVIKKNYVDYLRSNEFVENLFLHGRPYWGSLLQAEVKQFPDSFQAIYRMAESKLTAVSSHIPNSTVPQDVDALALLGQTVYIEPISASEYGGKLIEARMGWLKMVDVFNNHFFVATVYPEPVLSLVAAQILFTSDGNSLVNCLSRFSKMTEIGVANVGADGEFVIRTAFYVARMIAKPHIGVDYQSDVLEPAQPRFLVHVLESLAPVSPIVGNVLGAEFCESLVSFTHWIKLDSAERMEGDVKVTLNLEYVLQQALIRSSALIMPDRFKGIDLMIPIVTRSGKLGAVLLQVKNYQENTPEKQSKAFGKMLLFARENDLTDRCVYMLTFTNPKQDTTNATISHLHGNTSNALLNNLPNVADPNLPNVADSSSDDEDSASSDDENNASSSRKKSRKKPASSSRKKSTSSPKLKLPCLVMRGLHFSFREEEVQSKESEHGLRVPPAAFGQLRTLLVDLADMYRDVGNRFVPKFANYHQRDENLFELPEAAQAVVELPEAAQAVPELPVAAQTVGAPEDEAGEKDVIRRVSKRNKLSRN